MHYITRKSCMWEHKCPNQLNWTLNRLYPASSLVQSPCNVWLSPCENKAGNCPENSQRASRCVDDVSIRWLTYNQKRTNTWGCRRRVIYKMLDTHTQKKKSNWRDDKIQELLSVRTKAKIVRQIQRTARDCYLWPNYKLATQPRYNPHHALPLHALPRHHCSPGPNEVFPIGEYASDTDSLLLFATF